MHHERLIAEIAQKVEAEYTPQPRTRITPKMTAQLAARMKRRKIIVNDELASAKEVAILMRIS